MQKDPELNKLPLALAIAVAVAAMNPTAAAQEPQEPQDEGIIRAPSLPKPYLEYSSSGAETIEEVVVLGRFVSSSQQLVNERMNDAFSSDVLDDATISRLGDSTVASALRRVPGLTLVQDKFVYIRGLGERYSQSTLNGAQIPSPDLTRNVIPLDVFPTAVVQSLKVQKSWAPSISANFGGGAVAIRTKGIPDGFVYGIEAGLGTNSANPNNVMSYNGGGRDSFGSDDGTRALAPAVSENVAAYQGNPSVQNIYTSLNRQDSSTSLFDAETENRRMASALNRDIGLKETTAHPDYQLRGHIGNSWDLSDEWSAGASVGGAYQTAWRYRETLTADFGVPDEQNGVKKESTKNTNLTGTLNFGLKYLEDHDISTTTLALRNTDDETEIFDFFNENRPASGNIGFRDYRLQFEERNMLVNQIRGYHYIGADTRNKFAIVDSLLGWLPEESQLSWFFSTATAKTDIPNQVQVASEIHAHSMFVFITFDLLY